MDEKIRAAGEESGQHSDHSTLGGPISVRASESERASVCQGEQQVCVCVCVCPAG
jgi:hypothetical protein